MILTVKNLSIIYGTKKASDNISFSIKLRKVVGLFGANSAGKSSIIVLRRAHND